MFQLKNTLLTNFLQTQPMQFIIQLNEYFAIVLPYSGGKNGRNGHTHISG